MISEEEFLSRADQLIDNIRVCLSSGSGPTRMIRNHGSGSARVSVRWLAELLDIAERMRRAVSNGHIPELPTSGYMSQEIAREWPAIGDQIANQFCDVEAAFNRLVHKTSRQ